MEELKVIMQKFAVSGWDLIAVPAQEWLYGKADKDTLVLAIKQADKGWDLIAVPAQEWLYGKADKDTLVLAIKQADKECGNCGCELDSLYKRALELL